ncbi:MAG: hypothetical protein QOF61_955 [Acidobacteriota bacterium]|jgi:hypothetical protein|nr:hypothetical protein [Acidobacteriota bacterium]
MLKRMSSRAASVSLPASYAKRFAAALALLLVAFVAHAAAQANDSGSTSAFKKSKGTAHTKVLISNKGGISKQSPTSVATANFVYHELTNNFVATPTCPSGATDTACGRFVENTDRSGSAGFQIFSPETYTLHFKIEFQFFTNAARVYYTTDGSQPCGSFGAVGNVTQPNGTPCGVSNTTQVSTASYTCTYADQTQSCQVVDVTTGTIPPQPAGTTVRYIVSSQFVCTSGNPNSCGPEVFGNSGTCNGCFSATNSSDATNFQYNVIAPPATPLLISEFRLRGSSGASDEFVEIYNNGDLDVTVNAFDGSAGYALAASDGIARFTIPNGTVIPARGHYLGTNSVGYSLSTYPAGNGTTATGDATYTTNIADNAGIALFNTANPANFTLPNRLDAVGSTSEANTLYKEGTGYPALSVGSSTTNYSFYRDLVTGLPKDTNNNAADFLFVESNGIDAGAGVHLGAPGPENLSSPIQRFSLIKASLLDATTSSAAPPNRVRNFTSDPANNSTFGTLDTRRRFTNHTGSNVTRLRFRIVDITTFPSSPGIADLRARTSGDVIVSGVNDPGTCPGGATPCTVTVHGTTLEEAGAPNNQPNGGGFNSTLSAGTVTLATPLAPGAAINVHFLLGIQGTGSFRFFISIEALP